MWPFKPKRSDADIAIEEMPRAIEIASQKWIEFEKQPFARMMALEQKIIMFSEGLGKGLKEWKAFRGSPDSVFFLIAVKGIERSRTYLRIELEAALNIPVPGPHERSDEEESTELNKKLVDRAARKWQIFTQSLVFRDDAPLKQMIDAFKAPFLEGIRNDYPMFKDAQDDEFDSLIAIGIDQSGTHSIVEVHRVLRLDA